MFCPRCGYPDQTEKTYCRRCGNYLPDLTEPAVAAPEFHVKTNLVLGLVTVLTSFTIALMVYTFLMGGAQTSPLIYVMFGLSVAMGTWHVQTTWRWKKLGDHFRELKRGQEGFKKPEFFNPADT